MRVYRALLIGCIGAVAGCATAKPVPLPNGQQGFAIENCDSMAECYKKAAETCGGKYAVIGNGSETTPVVSSGGGIVSATAIHQYNIMVQCEK